MAHPAVSCYAESANGINWARPNLNIFEWEGSKENNIIWPDAPASHNFTPFRDENPGAPPESKFKALGGHKHGNLFGFVSPDGKSWKLIRAEPIIIDGLFALRGNIKGGSVITKTLHYSGTALLLNYVVRKGGSLR